MDFRQNHLGSIPLWLHAIARYGAMVKASCKNVIKNVAGVFHGAFKAVTLCGVLNEEIEVLWAAKLTQQNQESPATM